VFRLYTRQFLGFKEFQPGTRTGGQRGGDVAATHAVSPDPEEKTRANASGALGNLLRNSGVASAIYLLLFYFLIFHTITCKFLAIPVHLFETEVFPKKPFPDFREKSPVRGQGSVAATLANIRAATISKVIVGGALRVCGCGCGGDQWGRGDRILYITR